MSLPLDAPLHRGPQKLSACEAPLEGPIGGGDHLVGPDKAPPPLERYGKRVADEISDKIVRGGKDYEIGRASCRERV